MTSRCGARWSPLWTLWWFAGLLVGCGIPLDDTPRPVAAGRVVPSGTTSPAPGGGTSAYLYFVRNDRVAASAHDVADRSERTVLEALFAGPDPTDLGSGLVSQIPPGTRVESVTVDDGSVTVSISDELADVIGASRFLAYGQMVLTLTELEGVSTVQFRVGGAPAEVATPTRGDVSQVSDCDFLSLFPTDDQLRDTALDDDVMRHVAARRRTLEDRCPSR